MNKVAEYGKQLTKYEDESRNLIWGNRQGIFVNLLWVGVLVYIMGGFVVLGLRVMDIATLFTIGIVGGVFGFVIWIGLGVADKKEDEATYNESNRLDTKIKELRASLKQEIMELPTEEFEVVKVERIAKDTAKMIDYTDLRRSGKEIAIRVLIVDAIGRVTEVTCMCLIRIDKTAMTTSFQAIHIKETLAGRYSAGYYDGVITVRDIDDIPRIL